MSQRSDNPPSVPHEQIVEAYLKVFQLIDDRVAPLLGKVTTRVLVQVAASHIMDQYPYLHFLVKMPYTEIVPAVLDEQLRGVGTKELASGLDTLLQECFVGLKELTGNLIVPPLHDEVTHQLENLSY